MCMCLCLGEKGKVCVRAGAYAYMFGGQKVRPLLMCVIALSLTALFSFRSSESWVCGTKHDAKIDSATQVLQDSLESRPALRSRFAQVPAQHACDV